MLATSAPRPMAAAASRGAACFTPGCVSTQHCTCCPANRPRACCFPQVEEVRLQPVADIEQEIKARREQKRRTGGWRQLQGRLTSQLEGARSTRRHAADALASGLPAAGRRAVLTRLPCGRFEASSSPPAPTCLTSFLHLSAPVSQARRLTTATAMTRSAAASACRARSSKAPAQPARVPPCTGAVPRRHTAN